MSQFCNSCSYGTPEISDSDDDGDYVTDRIFCSKHQQFVNQYDSCEDYE